MKREGGEKGLHKGAVLQPPGLGRAFKGLGVAKRYCRRDSIGDSFSRRADRFLTPPPACLLFSPALP